jgi:CRISPR-associated protein Cas1
VLGCQIEKDNEYYGKLWKKVVEVKIQNQAKAYLRLKNDQEGAKRIAEFALGIIDSDKSNREAHAAKVYFNLLMGTSFSRGNEDILLNSGLDYGYAVLRGYIARVCVAYGLNTQIGIHHKSEYNRFNLVDDLMEPLRPIVDIVAYESMKNDKYFTPEHRRKLVNILNLKIRYRNKKMYVCNMIENYVEQYASLIMGRTEDIVFPDINELVGEEFDEI